VPTSDRWSSSVHRVPSWEAEPRKPRPLKGALVDGPSAPNKEPAALPAEPTVPERPRLPSGMTLCALCRPDEFGTPAVLVITLRPGEPVCERSVCGGQGTARYNAGRKLVEIEVRGRVGLGELARVVRGEPAAVRRWIGMVLPPALVRIG
jgi:hypothetical protein